VPEYWGIKVRHPPPDITTALQYSNTPKLINNYKPIRTPYFCNIDPKNRIPTRISNKIYAIMTLKQKLQIFNLTFRLKVVLVILFCEILTLKKRRL